MVFHIARLRQEAPACHPDLPCWRLRALHPSPLCLGYCCRVTHSSLQGFEAGQTNWRRCAVRNVAWPGSCRFKKRCSPRGRLRPARNLISRKFARKRAPRTRPSWNTGLHPAQIWPSLADVGAIAPTSAELNWSDLRPMLAKFGRNQARFGRHRAEIGPIRSKLGQRRSK